ncbi:hypothetical protein HPL003_08530 [Paenibacillus terrae HPL-003]|uniref:Uncharacterized protein n=1 Tax=Paenibacillus terrae (strain HPL-003) TaxID=985665 RepID=G7VYE1_PAETH|nr:hypothetical protein HPL003_08530 [Paenibacillus terrae HPL-003]
MRIIQTLILSIQKKLIPTHGSSWKELLNVYQVC